MSSVPAGTVTDPVAEAAPEGGGGDDKEGTEEVVYLRTCCPQDKRTTVGPNAAPPARQAEARRVGLLSSTGPLHVKGAPIASEVPL